MHKKLGFTLIELLTVVMILGILTAVALPQYRKAIQRATATNALTTLKTVFDSAKRYKSSTSSWPTAFNQLDVDLFDVSEEGVSGEYQYSFSGDNAGTVSACKTVDNKDAGTYCLNAHYRYNDGEGDKRDVYTCNYTTAKFKFICESLGKTCTNSTCVIQ